jgi:hypothetical protein
MAFLTSGILYSQAVGYVWPATRADSIWQNQTYGYKGPNTAYALGTLLAIPPSVNVATLGIQTQQAFNVAMAAQTYGMYVCDSTASSGNTMSLAMEYGAASNDLGCVVNPSNGWQSYDSTKINSTQFNADMITILHQCKAVTSNTH